MTTFLIAVAMRALVVRVVIATEDCGKQLIRSTPIIWKNVSQFTHVYDSEIRLLYKEGILFQVKECPNNSFPQSGTYSLYTASNSFNGYIRPYQPLIQRGIQSRCC